MRSIMPYCNLQTLLSCVLRYAARQISQDLSLDLFIPLRLIKNISRISKLARGQCIYNSNCIKTRMFKILFYLVKAKCHAFIVAVQKSHIRPLKYKIHHCIFVFLLFSKNWNLLRGMAFNLVDLFHCILGRKGSKGNE